MVKTHYRNKRPKDSSVAFTLQISIRKMLLVVVDKLWKKLTKLSQKSVYYTICSKAQTDA